MPEHQRAVAAGSVIAIAAVNLGGLTRTVAVTRVLLTVAVAVLAGVVGAGWTSPQADLGRLVPFDASVIDILQSAGFLFFALAGYARIATMGEEVQPETTIPKAIRRALGFVLVVYAVVAITVLMVVPATELADRPSPLRLVVDAGRLSGIGAVVRFGTGVAALGVLLNLIPGVSRTVLSIARRREFPRFLADIDRTRSLPVRAERTVTAVILILVLFIDLRDAIGFSSVTVLTYYAITNAAALTVDKSQRRSPRPFAAVGLAGCIALAVALPTSALLGGVIVLAIGFVVRKITVAATGIAPPCE